MCIDLVPDTPRDQRASLRARLTGRSLLVCLLLLTALSGTAPAATADSGAQAPVSADTGAWITAVRHLDDRTLDLTVRSRAMEGSVPVRVILPRSWKSEGGRTFPVLYMLHGGGDDYTSWTRETDVEALAENAEVLVVMPDGGKYGYYSDWYAGTPRWETFHTVELIRLMEKSFRANSSRAVIGLSMGGFGALNYAARHQGLFRYAASMSSYVDLDEPWVRFLLVVGNAADGTNLNDVWGDRNQQADNWRAHNPSAMPHAFRGTKIHLSSGTGAPGPLDEGRPPQVRLVGALAEAPLPASLERFAVSLRSAGVDVTTHLYEPGTHSWPYWRRELHRIWPTVMEELTWAER